MTAPQRYAERYWNERREHTATQRERDALRERIDQMESRLIGVLDDYLAGTVSREALQHVRRELEFQRYVVRGVPRTSHAGEAAE